LLKRLQSGEEKVRNFLSHFGLGMIKANMGYGVFLLGWQVVAKLTDCLHVKTLN
jgi:hypothetical protein